MKIKNKKMMFHFATIFLSIVAVASTCVMINVANAQVTSNTIRVPQDYSTIQGAIDSANPGDIVYVSSGTYHENLYIDKALTVIGEGKTNTFIIGYGDAVIQANFTTVNISGFSLSNGTIGIMLETCSESTVKDNIVEGMDAEAIWLFHSNHNTVSDNVVAKSYHGILLCGHSSENMVVGNTVLENEKGISLTGWNNTIFHNNFINNRNQTYVIESYANKWDNSLEGNYWSDYRGKDSDQNGVGDTPYPIDINNRDIHPLMGMAYQFQVTKGNELYEITAISNSTITDLTFENSIKIAVSDPEGTLGFCRLSLSRALSGDNPSILVNGEGPSSQSELPESTDSQLYLHIVYKVAKAPVIIPFWGTNPVAASTVIAAAVALVVLTVLTLLRRRR